MTEVSQKWIALTHAVECTIMYVDFSQVRAFRPVIHSTDPKKDHTELHFRDGWTLGVQESVDDIYDMVTA